MQNENQIGYKVNEREAGIIDFNFTRGSKTQEDSTQVAEKALKDLFKILEKYGEHEGLLLVQLVEDDGVVSHDAKEAYKKIMKDPRFARIAIFGGLSKYRRIARLLLKFTMGDTVKVFDSKGEAMQWLIQS